MPFAHRNTLLRTAVALATLVVAAVGFVWSGIYNIGADDHHTAFVHRVIETLRDRSIAIRARELQPPNLDDPQLILKGAGQYAAMCTGCHLAPGITDSEIRPGLYPQPPVLARERLDPKIAFWTIKHGIKMSAMPAWGGSHDDATIWSMVAFLRKLPSLSPAQYKDMVAKAPPDEGMDAMPGMSGAHSADHDPEEQAAPHEHR